jgi:hypothetical protein
VANAQSKRSSKRSTKNQEAEIDEIIAQTRKSSKEGGLGELSFSMLTKNTMFNQAKIVEADEESSSDLEEEHANFLIENDLYQQSP